MKVSFTGTRPPVPPFTTEEEDLIVRQLDDLDPEITEIGQGGCIGVDALIARAAWNRGFKVVTFLPGLLWRKYTDPDIWLWSTEIIDTKKNQPARNHDIVKFGDIVRGVALYEEHRQPRSGTWHAIRLARHADKLDRQVTLRPLTARTTDAAS